MDRNFYLKNGPEFLFANYQLSQCELFTYIFFCYKRKSDIKIKVSEIVDFVMKFPNHEKLKFLIFLWMSKIFFKTPCKSFSLFSYKSFQRN